MHDATLVSQIAERVLARISEADPHRVIVGVSNRHVHLTDDDFSTLFGYSKPTVRRYVRQHGEFAAEETVTLVGPKNTIERVRVMGPNRNATQVEIARTDCITLGVDAPIAQSGHLEHAAPVELRGPKGAVRRNAAIVAARHIHMGPDDARALGLEDQDLVRVAFGGQRGGVLDNLIIRVKDSFLQELHLDTDEANALGAASGDWVRICKD
ncbi:MAG: phosphate propanoyltransferase [Propionibacterium sp.]|nr:phosphate propanoyltransferase [Propionibacterium sp.]